MCRNLCVERAATAPSAGNASQTDSLFRSLVIREIPVARGSLGRCRAVCATAGMRLASDPSRHPMDRRTFLKSAARAGAFAAASGFTAPAISQGAAAKTVRLVPHADLANFDPIWTTAYISRNAGLLVWDTLYGV